MARELHDVIAHDVSVMVLQSSGARGVASERPSSGREQRWASSRARAVTRWSSCGGSSACSTAAASALAASAAPGLSQLDALVERARAAGLPVEVHVDGRLEALSPGLDLVAYRVVQEALTNAIKHAGAARARVNVTVDARCLELEVSDDGHGPAPDRDNDREPGHGLVGMSERVRLYGGELCAGRRTDSHGFEVHARIPLDGVAGSPQVVVTPARRRACDRRGRRPARRALALA